METLIINDKFLYIRKIKEYDIKDSYYNVMSVLSRKTIELLTVSSTAEIEEKLKERKIFLIEDVNSKQMVGSGEVLLLNYTSTIATIGCIEEIILKEKYDSDELREAFVTYLKKYCISNENCIHCIYNNDKCKKLII